MDLVAIEAHWMDLVAIEAHWDGFSGYRSPLGWI